MSGTSLCPWILNCEKAKAANQFLVVTVQHDGRVAVDARVAAKLLELPLIGNVPSDMGIELGCPVPTRPVFGVAFLIGGDVHIDVD
jgi:hypothetical protein